MSTLPVALLNDHDEPRWTETLRDRSSVLIRPITELDADAERAFIEHLSPEVRHFRFLGAIGTPDERLIRVDPDDSSQVIHELQL